MELLQKAEQEIAKQQLQQYLAENFPHVSDTKQIEFLLEYMITGQAARSYMKVYKNENYNSSAVLANRILKKVKFNVSDMLDATGHTIERLFQAITTLETQDPKEYVKYMMKLRGLDIQKQEIEHSGQIAATIYTSSIEDLDDTIST